MRITLVALFILFLTSCSLPFLKQDTHSLSYEEYKNALPKKITKKFKLNGKLSLFINKKGQTGKILWNFEDNKDSIDILNPFNTKIAEIILYELEKKVILKHALRNALVPTVTILGMQIGWMMGATVLVEEIFGRPGIGKYAVKAVTQSDIHAIVGVVLIVGVIFIISNLIVDIIHFFLNPRLRNN